MDLLANNSFAELLVDHTPPCLSIYQPTHRSHPDNAQDPIRFRNLVGQLEASLRKQHARQVIDALLAPFHQLADDAAFWNHTFDGLAVLGSAGLFRVFRLQRPVVEVAIVADSFHTKPLVRILQSADRYQVLGLSQGRARLFEGNRDALDEIELGAAAADTLAQAQPDPDRAVPTRGDRQGKPEHSDVDRERFFRAVDRAVLEHHSRPSGLPLMLVALPEHHTLFRSVSHNPQLLAEGLRIDPDAVTTSQLREMAWRAIEPQYLERLAALVDAFGAALGTGLAGETLDDVAAAAASGRVASLLVEAGRHIGGRVDDQTGRVQQADITDPNVGDLLDDVAEMVLRRGGEVVLVPTERMPTKTGLAATYRF